MRIDEIEYKISCNELNAAQVFTQMKQHIPTDHIVMNELYRAREEIAELEKILIWRDGGDHDIDCKSHKGRGCTCGHDAVKKYQEK